MELHGCGEKSSAGFGFNCALQSTIMPKGQLLATLQKPVLCQMADFYVIYHVSL